jgi:hypothetical protein
MRETNHGGPDCRKASSKRVAVSAVGAALAIGCVAGVIGTQSNAVLTVGADVVDNASAEESHVVHAVAEGEFEYGQNVITSNETIRDTFSRASQTMCDATGAYEGVGDVVVSVGGDVRYPGSATVGEMRDKLGTTSQTLTCACTSNPAGGNIIATSEVQGVAIYDIASAAGAVG